MGDTFFSLKPNNLVVFILYCNLQLIHNFLKTGLLPPTHAVLLIYKKMCFKNGLEELQVGSAKQGF
jgi:hypothetical protein